MPDRAHLLHLAEGLELFMIESIDGVRLETYRRTLSTPSALKIDRWPAAARDAFRNKRFATVDALVAALRSELGL